MYSKKGVYKDRHERKDVEYRDTIFLPRLAELEPTLVRRTYPYLDNDNRPAGSEKQEEPVLAYPDDLPQ